MAHGEEASARAAQVRRISIFRGVLFSSTDPIAMLAFVRIKPLLRIRFPYMVFATQLLQPGRRFVGATANADS
eukprot:5964159-Pleurochrysis_carterae.AAC.3